MKDHTNQCYKRHEVAPGVHQDVPHTACKPLHTVEVPSGDVAEAFQLAINRAIYDAWQEGYQQGKTDATNRWKQDLQEALDQQAAINRHNALSEAGIQHDGDFPEHCPLYCTKHNHEEMGG